MEKPYLRRKWRSAVSHTARTPGRSAHRLQRHRLDPAALPFAADHQQLVRELLAQDSALPGELHGKTGSCPGDPDAGRPAHAWFIGWVDWDRRRERNPATSWFAVSITGDEADGQRARSMTLRLLADSQPPE